MFFFFIDWRYQTSKAAHHKYLITQEKQKVERGNYWKLLVRKELAVVLIIIWYIKVEPLCTQQLPTYITMSQFLKVLSRNRDINKQLQKVYNVIYITIQNKVGSSLQILEAI